MTDPTPTCPVCRLADSRAVSPCPDDYEYGVATAGRFRLFACRPCGTEFVDPRPNAEELRAIYPDDYYAYAQGLGTLSQALYDWRVGREAKYFLTLAQRRPLKLFDVGAGDCRHFAAIAPVGPFRFYGVEMNGVMAAHARSAGYDVVASTFDDYDPSPHAGEMDVVTMNHVIEHVIDPEAALIKAHGLLTEGGVLYGRLPKLDGLGREVFRRYWGGYHFPRHLHLPPADALRALLRRCGFREVEVHDELNRFLALSLQNAIVGGLRVPLRRRSGHTWIMPALLLLTAPLSALEWALGYSDCMLFVARK